MSKSTINGAKQNPAFRHPADYDGDLAILFDPAARQGRGRGIFIVPAATAAAQDICVMAVKGRGIVTVTLMQKHAARLGLKPQAFVPANGHAPYYAVSVEAVSCRETGISADERALTMRVVGAAQSTAENIISPGHVMVQVSRDIFRNNAELSEIGYRLVTGIEPDSAVGWCDILDETGDLASLAHCLELSKEFDLPLYDAHEVIAHLQQADKYLENFSAFTYNTFM